MQNKVQYYWIASQYYQIAYNLTISCMQLILPWLKWQQSEKKIKLKAQIENQIRYKRELPDRKSTLCNKLLQIMHMDDSFTTKYYKYEQEKYNIFFIYNPIFFFFYYSLKQPHLLIYQCWCIICLIIVINIKNIMQLKWPLSCIQNRHRLIRSYPTN